MALSAMEGTKMAVCRAVPPKLRAVGGRAAAVAAVRRMAQTDFGRADAVEESHGTGFWGISLDVRPVTRRTACAFAVVVLRSAIGDRERDSDSDAERSVRRTGADAERGGGLSRTTSREGRGAASRLPPVAVLVETGSVVSIRCSCSMKGSHALKGVRDCAAEVCIFACAILRPI